MPFKNEKILLACEHCQCVNETEFGGNSVEIKVPVRDFETGKRGMAYVDLEVVELTHQLTLTRLEGDDGFELQLDGQGRERLNRLLATLANAKLCGNKNICPRMVEEYFRLYQQQA